LWPADPIAEARILSLIGFLAASVHPAVAHMWRPERYSTDSSAFSVIQETGRNTFDGYLKQIDERLAGRRWFSDQYSVADPYLFVFYVWALRRGYPAHELKNFTALKSSLLQRPAVQQVLAKEKIDVPA